MVVGVILEGDRDCNHDWRPDGCGMEECKSCDAVRFPP